MTRKTDLQDGKVRTRSRETYVGRVDVILRYCELFDLKPTDVISKDAWAKIRRGVGVEKSHYSKLSKRFNCDITSVMRVPLPEQPGDPVVRFARRLRDLIDDGTIPDETDGRPTDVVAAAWRSHDAKLRSIRLSYDEQVAAFRYLRDEYGYVTEEPPTMENGRPSIIGEMRVFFPLIDDVLHDVEDRREMATEAFEYLKEDYLNGGQVWFGQVSFNFTTRHDYYKNAEAAFKSRPSEDTLEGLIRTDRDCRGTLFRPGKQLDRFESVYSRSAWLLRRLYRKDRSYFDKMFPEFLSGNSKDLMRLRTAFTAQPPRFADMTIAAEATISRAESQLKRLFRRIQSQKRPGSETSPGSVGDSDGAGIVR